MTRRAATSDLFQSTPPAEARGDLASPSTTGRDSSFNPLPPPKRGETEMGAKVPPWLEVSIHSPRRSEGRHPDPAAMISSAVFQSTPPAEARGDTILAATES